MIAHLSRALAPALSTLGHAVFLFSVTGSIPATLALLFGTPLLSHARRRLQAARLAPSFS